MSARLQSIKLASFLWAASMGGCGGEAIHSRNIVGESGCAPEIARISVQDGFLQAICGCAEGDGILAFSSQELQCTIPKGTYLIFSYVGSTLKHQVVSNSNPTFPSSPIADPDESDGGIQFHSVHLQEPGVFNFSDAFFSSVSGKITVVE